MSAVSGVRFLLAEEPLCCPHAAQGDLYHARCVDQAEGGLTDDCLALDTLFDQDRFHDAKMTGRAIFVKYNVAIGCFFI